MFLFSRFAVAATVATDVVLALAAKTFATFKREMEQYDREQRSPYYAEIIEIISGPELSKTDVRHYAEIHKKHGRNQG